MDYRNLGRSGLKISPLVLGSMMFGGPTDEPTARRIIDQAREHGVNFLDTADVYNDGRSEEVVGRAVKGDRDHWVIATKLAGPKPTDMVESEHLSGNHPLVLADLDNPNPGQLLDGLGQNPADHLGRLVHHL